MQFLALWIAWGLWSKIMGGFEFKIIYGWIYISTAAMTYTFLLNHKDRYFSPLAFPSFYPKVRDFISGIKINAIIAVYALIYQVGVFVISLPLSSIIVLSANVDKSIQSNLEIVVCFMLNIAFVPLLPTIYYIIIGILSNSLITFIQHKLESKLGVKKNEDFKEGIERYRVDDESENELESKPEEVQKDIHIHIKGDIK